MPEVMVLEVMMPEVMVLEVMVLEVKEVPLVLMVGVVQMVEDLMDNYKYDVKSNLHHVHSMKIRQAFLA